MRRGLVRLCGPRRNWRDGMRIRLAAIAVAGFMLAGCYQPPPRFRPREERIREADIDAWKGAPIIDLETHPLFSRLSLEKRTLSDGSEMWFEVECVDEKVPLECRTTAMPIGQMAVAKTKCSGGDVNRWCCQNQFHIVGDKVDWWQPHGDACVTNCKLRPASNGCEPTP